MMMMILLLLFTKRNTDKIERIQCSRAQSLFLALGALVLPGVIFWHTAEILGAEFKILGSQLQIPVAPTPKEYSTLQKEQLGLLVAIWASSSSIEHNENK